MTPPTPRLLPGVTRVRDASGFVGTVAYVGPVASAKSPTEVYAGVAWDDVTRGRHDGSVICRATNRIVRHFKCGPTQGSFLRLSKVDAGAPLTPGLMRSRYVAPGAALVAPGNLLPHAARTVGGRDKPIEFWGEVKIRGRQQLEEAEEISLRMLGINGPCGPGERAGMGEFGHLRSIDLAGNLLSDWEDVLEILGQFENLVSLSLASNRINDLNPASLDGFSMMRMINLNLNSTNIGSFKTVQLIGNAMPNLEELCVAHCNLSDLEFYSPVASHADDAPDDGNKIPTFQNLVLLDLSDCQLTSWVKQILPFCNLPRLKSLILNDNGIDHITLMEKHTTIFPKLASLQLAGTSVSSWSALDSLNCIPSLRALRFRNTPLTSSLGVGEVRSTAIARLSNLDYFNASPIADRERTEAERRYVSNVARELLMVSSHAVLAATDQSLGLGDKKAGEDEPNSKQAQIYAHHPRFRSLMEKHKDTMMSSSSVSNLSHQGNIGEDVIGLTIRSMAASSCDMEPLRKRIPRSLKVSRVKAMCARAFGLDIDLQILHFRIEGDPFPTELDDADHTLAYYGVTDGAEILVNEVNVEAREKERVLRSMEHNRRVDEQEQHVAVLQSVQRNDHHMHLIGTEMSQTKI